MQTKTNLILASDIHLCHADWLGVPSAERVQRFIDDLRREYQARPFAALLLLGDYSLDHWKWNIKGSYLEKGISYTHIFVEQYLSQLRDLPIEIRMIAGNHEQYGDALWHTLTGHQRRELYVNGDWLFILMDTYRADLDPTTHSDGSYTGADLAFIRDAMAQYPDKRVVLCSHYLDPARETEEFRTLLREEKRIICLVCGHTHRAEIRQLPAEYGEKYMLFTGQYGEPPANTMWGYRRLTLTDTALESCYVTPANEILRDGERILHPYGEQDAVKIDLLPLCTKE